MVKGYGHIRQAKHRDHSALLQLLHEFRRDGEAYLAEHVLQLFLQGISLTIELVHLLFELGVLLKDPSVLLQQDGVFLLLATQLFLSFALLH
jgi:hypothetical protein